MRKPLYLITWEDPHSDCEWANCEQIEKFLKERAIVTEVGWIVDDNKEGIVISNQFSSDGDFGNKTKILKKLILSKKKLKFFVGRKNEKRNH